MTISLEMINAILLFFGDVWIKNDYPRNQHKVPILAIIVNLLKEGQAIRNTPLNQNATGHEFPFPSKQKHYPVLTITRLDTEQNANNPATFIKVHGPTIDFASIGVW